MASSAIFLCRSSFRQEGNDIFISDVAQERAYEEGRLTPKNKYIITFLAKLRSFLYVANVLINSQQ